MKDQGINALSTSSQLIKDIYGDLARPGVRQIGVALGTVLGLGNTALAPLALFNAKASVAFKANMEAYRQQLAQVPLETVEQVPPELGIPVLERLAYTTDEQLRGLFINLLAKASTVGTANAAHPGFVHVIANMSPDEAHLLKNIKSQLPDVMNIPFLTLALVDKADNGFQVIADFIVHAQFSIGLRYKQNMAVYFSNLEGMGIVHVRRDLTLKTERVYDGLQEEYNCASI
jgi:hypothetical protein